LETNTEHYFRKSETIPDRKLVAARRARAMIAAGIGKHPDELALRLTVFCRQQLIHRRVALESQWQRLFPVHEFTDLRLKNRPTMPKFDLSTFERLCDEAEREAKRKSEQKRPLRTRPTPQMTVEAVWCCIRERGPVALKESANRARLKIFDGAARAELRRRLAKLKSQI
jgi:hypothetical protein